MIRTKKILVVDDEPACLELLTSQLTERRYEVLTATDGKEGLEKIKHENPDLIILDIKMPVMDGVTMLDILRKEKAYEKTKVIILTNIELEDKVIGKILNDQPLYYFMKSDIRFNDLLDKIEEILDE